MQKTRTRLREIDARKFSDEKLLKAKQRQKPGVKLVITLDQKIMLERSRRQDEASS